MITVTNSKYTLLQGDCFEQMRSIPSGSVDLVLCDLPFGCTENDWDKQLPFAPLWDEYRRVLKVGGLAVLFAKKLFTFELGLSNSKAYKYKLVWQKNFGTDFLNAKRKPLSCHEDILVFSPNGGNGTYNPQMRRGFEPYQIKGAGTASPNYRLQKVDPAACAERIAKSQGERAMSDDTRLPIDVVTFSRRRKAPHPTAKPIPLCEWLIKTYSNEGETVLDNCMGSGTTGIACMRTGRKFIGIELSPKYFEVAKELMQKETSIIELGGGNWVIASMTLYWAIVLLRWGAYLITVWTWSYAICLLVVLVTNGTSHCRLMLSGHSGSELSKAAV